jgi:predicted PP-loop superfamily ATPase
VAPGMRCCAKTRATRASTRWETKVVRWAIGVEMVVLEEAGGWSRGEGIGQNGVIDGAFTKCGECPSIMERRTGRGGRMCGR